MKRVLLGLLLLELIELVLLVEAGEAFGTWFPIAAVVLSTAAGGLVIRHYGLQTLKGLKDTLRSGAPPAAPRPTGVAGVMAGILLILPGFLSDLAAIILLIPAARRRVAAALGWRASRAGFAGQRRNPYGPIIEAEAVEIRGEAPGEHPARRHSPWR